jgi:rhodanese-related sulfurtransferase
MGAKAKDLTELELCYAPPYSSAKDPVNMAGYVIENIITRKVKIFHWHDIEKLRKDQNVILLDVRTLKEYEAWHIEGFINLPLDDLRTNLDKLDRSKKIYLTCRVGLRGYIACRILCQKGFDVYNLSGGCMLWWNIFKDSPFKG